MLHAIELSMKKRYLSIAPVHFTKVLCVAGLAALLRLAVGFVSSNRIHRGKDGKR